MQVALPTCGLDHDITAVAPIYAVTKQMLEDDIDMDNGLPDDQLYWFRQCSVCRASVIEPQQPLADADQSGAVGHPHERPGPRRT